MAKGELSEASPANRNNAIMENQSPMYEISLAVNSLR